MINAYDLWINHIRENVPFSDHDQELVRNSFVSNLCRAIKINQVMKKSIITQKIQT